MKNGKAYVEKVEGNLSFRDNFLFVVGYAAIFLTFQLFLYKLGLVNYFPDEKNLLSGDAGWYHSIAESGYSYSSGGQSNAGFYYLFPLVWKLVGCNVWAICVLNVLFFSVGMSILVSEYRISEPQRILFLSMPQVIIAFVPYSEALFFMLSALCIWGIMKDKRTIVWVTLFLLSLTRATTITLIPALILMELLSQKKSMWRIAVKKFFINSFLPVVFGLAVFVGIQYAYTGVWLAYFKAQANFWMRIFSVPIFPLYAGAPDTLWYNAIAVFVCLLAAIFLVYFIVKWFSENMTYEKGLLFSIGYLAVTLFLALFYSPKWDIDRTSLIGTYRYALLTPFFFRFLIFLLKDVSYSWKHYLFAFLLSNFVWLCFGSYVHLQAFLMFTGNTVIVMFYMLCTRKLLWPAIMLTAINFAIQIFFFQEFVSTFHLID